MSDEKRDEEEEKKKKEKKDKHPFDMTIEERRRLGLSGNKNYFEEVKRLLQNSKKLKEKPKQEKNRINEMLSQKEKEIERLKASKNKKGLAMAQADKKFLKKARSAMPFIKMQINADIMKLELILATRVKMSYNVIVDFYLKPLPSQRQNDKNNDKDKDKNNDKNSDKKQNGGKGNGSSKNAKSPEEIEKNKQGRHLYNLTRNGRNDNLAPLQKKRRLRSNRSPQKALQYAPSRDTGR